MDDDFKDLEEKEYLINKKNLIIILVASLIITFLYQFHFQGYFFEGIMPFIILISSLLIIFSSYKRNRKAYLLFIPMILIMISDFIVEIDSSNKLINILMLTFLILSFFLLLYNKHYKLKENILYGIINLFPEGLFSNLRYFKISKQDYDKQKIFNIFKGIGFGCIFGIIILALLAKADDYFSEFIDKILNGLGGFEPKYIIIFILSFILIFSLVINIMKHNEDKMKEFKILKIDHSIIISFLIVINSIFILFLVSQISKITNNFLALPIEYTYSSYAREGFFQLLFVTLINFVIILFLKYKTNLIKENKVIKILTIILICFSIVLIFNSYYRMYLYINHFGFTILRMQVILFLLLELIMFIIMIFEIIKNFKKNNTVIYFILINSFYLINLYLCNDWFANILNNCLGFIE